MVGDRSTSHRRAARGPLEVADFMINRYLRKTSPGWTADVGSVSQQDELDRDLTGRQARPTCVDMLLCGKMDLPRKAPGPFSLVSTLSRLLYES